MHLSIGDCDPSFTFQTLHLLHLLLHEDGFVSLPGFIKGYLAFQLLAFHAGGLKLPFYRPSCPSIRGAFAPRRVFGQLLIQLRVVEFAFGLVQPLAKTVALCSLRMEDVMIRSQLH